MLSMKSEKMFQGNWASVENFLKVKALKELL